MLLAGGIHWGTVWTCVAALAAAVASIIALGVALVETRRRNADLERAERADAALITVTVDWRGGSLSATLTNHSGIPILDADIVKAEIQSERGGRGSVLPNAEQQKRGGQPLRPGGKWPVTLASSYEGRDAQWFSVGEGDRVIVTYQYIDARGQLWEREANWQPKKRPRDDRIYPLEERMRADWG